MIASLLPPAALTAGLFALMLLFAAGVSLALIRMLHHAKSHATLATVRLSAARFLMLPGLALINAVLIQTCGDRVSLMPLALLPLAFAATGLFSPARQWWSQWQQQQQAPAQMAMPPAASDGNQLREPLCVQELP